MYFVAVALNTPIAPAVIFIIATIPIVLIAVVRWCLVADAVVSFVSIALVSTAMMMRASR